MIFGLLSIVLSLTEIRAEAFANPNVETSPEIVQPKSSEKNKISSLLSVQIVPCWNVGALSSEALGVTITVGMQLGRDGVPDGGTLRLLQTTGGSDTAARQAYEAARRAILRCGAQGFDLPAEKYDQWRDIEMTFNPESMRIR